MDTYAMAGDVLCGPCAAACRESLAADGISADWFPDGPYAQEEAACCDDCGMSLPAEVVSD